jgi:hypothetical protein
MTGNAMPRSINYHLGFLLPASWHSDWAARMEAASWWWANRAWDIALQHHAGTPRTRMCHRHRRQQGFRIGVAWRLEQSLSRRNLYNLAEVHDGNTMADVFHHAQIMCNEKIAQAEFLL